MVSNPEAWTIHRSDECDEQWSRLIQESRLESNFEESKRKCALATIGCYKHYMKEMRSGNNWLISSRDRRKCTKTRGASSGGCLQLAGWLVAGLSCDG